MTEKKFAELSQAAAELDYNHRITLLNLLAQSLYKDEIPQYKDAMNGLDEAIAEEKRGEVYYYDTFDDLMADLKNA
ncbi:MAG: hypothetical protein J6W46_06460 [Spirochaetaceae bacterium]|nr:hypothetical protein [Spirochaetaceae bacterium]MBP5793268.1 hypothetical protein [Spirochaetaceae bacterium]